jgi:tetratricopeptide (TPR) repeat protein
MTSRSRLCCDPFRVAVFACALLAGACSSRDATPPASGAAGSVLNPPAGSSLQPVTLPDLSGMETAARQQMQTRFASLKATVENRASTPEDLAAAYGEMGKLLMAATHLDAAEACYLNAQALAPRDRRWPYYLGHIYKGKGPLEKSVAAFEQALTLAPNDVAAIVWLGEAYLARGRADAADPLFAKALALQPSAAAWFGSGRAALTQKDYARAVKNLNEALRLDPRASAAHYPLALAYRGLGDLRKAEAHLAQKGDIEPRPPDPFMAEIDGLLQSAEAYNVRGGRELEAGNWNAAADYFRKGLELAPNDASLRHRLGTALYQMGDARGAIEQFEQVVRTTPDHARSHFSLGILMNESGRYAEAADRFSSVLKYEPGNVDARVELAGVLARSGRPLEALDHYEKALAQAPTHSDAAFGRAMTLVRLARYKEARDRLEEGMKSHPDRPMFSHALARVLAAAPDDQVRDGRRALALVDTLIKQQQTIELAETTAMALAELRRYREAAAVQRDALTAAKTAGLRDVELRIAENLRLYEHSEPCRRPFGETELP